MQWIPAFRPVGAIAKVDRQGQEGLLGNSHGARKSTDRCERSWQ